MERVTWNTVDRVALVEGYRGGKTLEELGSSNGVRKQTIANWLERLGESRRDCHCLKPGRDLRLVKEFSSWCEASSYYLGLFYADGSLDDSSGVTAGWELQRDDREVIDYLARWLSFYEPYVELTERKGKPYVRLRLRGQLFIKFLVELGLRSGKSCLDLDFPSMPEVSMSHFIRGYFDGDGGVYKTQSSVMVRFFGTQKFLRGLNQVLEKKCEVNSRLYSCSSSGYCFYLQYARLPWVEAIGHYLYGEATIFLERKFQRFTDYGVL